MALVNVKEKTFLNPTKSITKIPDHYVNVPGFVPAANIPKEYKDLGYIPAGVLFNATDRKAVAIVNAKESAGEYDGVNFNNVQIQEQGANVAVLIHGFLRKEALVNAEQATCTNKLIEVL